MGPALRGEGSRTLSIGQRPCHNVPMPHERTPRLQKVEPALECRSMYRKRRAGGDGAGRRGRVRRRHRRNECLGRLWPLPRCRRDRWPRRSDPRLLEAEIRVCGGRFRGIRHGVPRDGNDAIQKFATRAVPHRVRDPKFREGFSNSRLWASVSNPGSIARNCRARSTSPVPFRDTTIILNHVDGVLRVGPMPAAGRRSAPAGARTSANWPHTRTSTSSWWRQHDLVRFDFHERDVPPSSEDLAAAWRQYIEPCIEAFGVNRCMLESNFPPDMQSGGYTELWNAFKRITASASAAEKTALYSGTAGRVYRLTVP
jgi:L-fuconolactonase